MKLFFFDCETTGLKAGFHEIHQLAILVVCNGKLMAEKNFKIRPTHMERCADEALEIASVTREQLEQYPDQRTVYLELLGLLGTFVDKFDKTDKFILSGYNVARFDENFLREFFKSMGDKYFGSWFHRHSLDVMQMVIPLFLFGRLPGLDSLKLGALCEYFGVEIQAHDALSDIKATREILKRVGPLFQGGVVK